MEYDLIIKQLDEGKISCLTIEQAQHLVKRLHALEEEVRYLGAELSAKASKLGFIEDHLLLRL